MRHGAVSCAAFNTRALRGQGLSLIEATGANQDNLLLLVDQFEELFCFGLSRGDAEAREEAETFTALLLAGWAVLSWNEADRQKSIAQAERQHADQQARRAREQWQRADRRLRELCEAGKAASTFLEENLPMASRELRSRLHATFAFDADCRP